MNLQIITHLIVAGAAALAVWMFQDARWGADVAELKLTHSDAQLKAVSKVRADERAIAATYQGALNAARDREAALRRDADAARRESDSLREQNADAARRIANATPTAVAEYAVALGDVFGDCSARYEALAAKAAGHASDVRTFFDGWPVMPAK